MKSALIILHKARMRFSSRHAVIVLLGALITMLIVERIPILSGDTTALANSAPLLNTCLREHHWIGCDGATQFGITQYLPAMFLSWRGMGADGVVLSLALLNTICFLLSAFVAWKFPMNHPSNRVALVLCIMCSPLIAYAPFTFGEELICCLVLTSLFSLRTGRSALFVFATVLSVASKETAVFSIAPIVLAVFLISPRRERVRAAIVVSSIVFGVILLISFNYFKFGTWKNVVHSDPALRVSELQRKFELVLGLIFSPNGGLIWYWPVVILLVAIPGILFWSDLVKGRFWSVGPSALILAAFAIQILGLANWYAPFGWVAWGPRLMLPTATGTIVASLALYDSRTKFDAQAPREILGELRGTIYAITSICTIFSLVAALGFVRKPGFVLSWFGRASATCPTPAVIQQDRDYYFHCLSYGTWKVNKSIVELSIRSFAGIWSSLALAVALCVVVQLIRNDVLRDPVTQVQCNEDQTEDKHS